MSKHIELDSLDFEPSGEEIAITVFSRKDEGEEIGKMIFGALTLPVLEQYRTLWNSGAERGKAITAAMTYAFDMLYRRFEPENPNAEIEIGHHESLKEFFLAECPLLIDRVIDEYFSSALPEVGNAERQAASNVHHSPDDTLM